MYVWDIHAVKIHVLSIQLLNQADLHDYHLYFWLKMKFTILTILKYLKSGPFGKHSPLHSFPSILYSQLTPPQLL